MRTKYNLNYFKTFYRIQKKDVVSFNVSYSGDTEIDGHTKPPRLSSVENLGRFFLRGFYCFSFSIKVWSFRTNISGKGMLRSTS